MARQMLFSLPIYNAFNPVHTKTRWPLFSLLVCNTTIAFCTRWQDRCCSLYLCITALTLFIQRRDMHCSLYLRVTTVALYTWTHAIMSFYLPARATTVAPFTQRRTDAALFTSVQQTAWALRTRKSNWHCSVYLQVRSSEVDNILWTTVHRLWQEDKVHWKDTATSDHCWNPLT